MNSLNKGAEYGLKEKKIQPVLSKKMDCTFSLSHVELFSMKEKWITDYSDMWIMRSNLDRIFKGFKHLKFPSLLLYLMVDVAETDGLHQ